MRQRALHVLHFQIKIAGVNRMLDQVLHVIYLLVKFRFAHILHGVLSCLLATASGCCNAAAERRLMHRAGWLGILPDILPVRNPT